MGRLSERLNRHALIGLDTAVFIYHFEANPRYLPLTQELLMGVQAGQRRLETAATKGAKSACADWPELSEGVGAGRLRVVCCREFIRQSPSPQSPSVPILPTNHSAHGVLSAARYKPSPRIRCLCSP